jgi:hypothetical protein
LNIEEELKNSKKELVQLSFRKLTSVTAWRNGVETFVTNPEIHCESTITEDPLPPDKSGQLMREQ